MRATLKRVAEAALLLGGAARVGRRLRRNDALILLYHNILPDASTVGGDRSLHVSRHQFAGQLDALRRTHSVVALDQVVRGAVDGHARPRVAITFDDAYRGALSCGLEELGRRDMPATFFVAPGLLGNQLLWWDAVAASPSGLSAQAREMLLTRFGGRQEEIRHWAVERAAWSDALPAEARTATIDELSAAAQRPGVRLASHSWSHPNLARCEQAELQDELERPLRWLRERFGDRVLSGLAFPYGRFTAETERAVLQAGYEWGVRVDGGWLAGSDGVASRLPRLNIASGLTRRGFELRLSGLLTGR